MAWVAMTDWAYKDLVKASRLNIAQDDIKYVKDLVKGDNAEASGATGHNHDGNNGLITHPINQAYWE